MSDTPQAPSDSPVRLMRDLATARYVAAVSTIGMLGGLGIVLDGHVLGWALVALMFLGLCVGLAMLHPRSGYLELDARGFTQCVLFRTKRILWSEVDAFATVSMPVGQRRSLVGFNLKPESRSLRERVRTMNRRIVGVDDTLRDPYGMSPEQLTLLMNHYLVAARRSVRAT